MGGPLWGGPRGADASVQRIGLIRPAAGPVRHSRQQGARGDARPGRARGKNACSFKKSGIIQQGQRLLRNVGLCAFRTTLLAAWGHRTPGQARVQVGGLPPGVKATAEDIFSPRARFPRPPGREVEILPVSIGLIRFYTRTADRWRSSSPEMARALSRTNSASNPPPALGGKLPVGGIPPLGHVPTGSRFVYRFDCSPAAGPCV